MSAVTQDAIIWRDVEDAISAWVNSALGIETQWADQAEPQPAYPFAMLRTDSQQQYGADAERKVVDNGDNTFNLDAVTHDEIMVSIQIDVGPPNATDPDASAKQLASRLLASLGLDTFSAPLNVAGLAFIAQAAPILDASIPLGGSYTDRKVLDLRFGLASRVTETVGVIEQAEISGVASMPDGATVTIGPITTDPLP